MLKEWEKSEKPSEEEIKARLEAVKEKLARQQSFDQREESTGSCCA